MGGSCNNNIIGSRAFGSAAVNSIAPPVDDAGHGTHTDSTAAPRVGGETSPQRGAELEERLDRFRGNATAWQARALSEQAAAVTLHAQLQQAAAVACA